MLMKLDEMVVGCGIGSSLIYSRDPMSPIDPNKQTNVLISYIYKYTNLFLTIN